MDEDGLISLAEAFTTIIIILIKVLIIFFIGLCSGVYLADHYGGINGLLALVMNNANDSGTGDGNASRRIINILHRRRSSGQHVLNNNSRSAIIMRSGGTRSGTNSAIGRDGNLGRVRCEAGNDPVILEPSVNYTCSCTETDISDKKDETKISSSEWCIKPSKIAIMTRNYISEALIVLKGSVNPQKSIITFSLDDPCIYGNFTCPKELKTAMLDAVTSIQYNGYAPSIGLPEARGAIAEYMSRDGVNYESEDIIIYNGCAGALENCISVLAGEDEGHNILIPKPGYPMYRTIAEGIGIKCKFYNLLADKNWEVDLAHLESQIDSSTAVIIVNNPSNPCGSVYSAEHLKAIAEIAYRHKLPIIADEIHDRIVFSGKKFVSIAAIESDVPRLICSGIGKNFIVPGWRCGWVAIQDPAGHFEKEIRTALEKFCTRIVGSCVINQGAIIKGLNKVPQSYFDNICKTLGENAKVCYNLLDKIPGLKPIMPEGAFCMMVEIEKCNFPEFAGSMDFANRLLKEQSVFCLPGECFDMPFHIRLAITPPANLLEEGIRRMSTFCCKYFE